MSSKNFLSKTLRIFSIVGRFSVLLGVMFNCSIQAMKDSDEEMGRKTRFPFHNLPEDLLDLLLKSSNLSKRDFSLISRDCHAYACKSFTIFIPNQERLNCFKARNPSGVYDLPVPASLTMSYYCDDRNKLFKNISKKKYMALTSLNLAASHLGIFQAELIGNALKTNTSLTELVLRSNYLRCRGVASISDALITNSTLKKLDLGNNLVEHEGILSISKALKINTTLTKLDLEFNKIDDVGATSIAEALITNFTLKELELGHNFNEAGRNVLYEACKINKTVKLGM